MRAWDEPQTEEPVASLLPPLAHIEVQRVGNVLEAQDVVAEEPEITLAPITKELPNSL